MKRRRRDLIPLVVRVANCEAVSERRPQDEARLALTKEGRHGHPDVVLFSEVSPLDLRLLGDRHGFDVLQYGRPGSAESGVALAVRRETASRKHRGKLVVGSRETREGGGIRMRPLISDRVCANGSVSVPLWALHAPPPRAPIARARYLGKALTRRGAKGGDFNHPLVELLRLLDPRHRARADGVLSLVTPRWVATSPATAVDIESDHDAVDVVLYLPPKKETVR